MIATSLEGVFWLAMTPKQRSNAWEREIAEIGATIDSERIRESVKCDVDVFRTSALPFWASEFTFKLEQALVPGCHLMSKDDAVPQLMRALGLGGGA